MTDFQMYSWIILGCTFVICTAINIYTYVKYIKNK